MARVWFVRRRGGQWIAPGGAPAFELPFAELVFPLDLGTASARCRDRAAGAGAGDSPAEPAALHKVFIEVEPQDLAGLEFTGYEPGVYDSPYSPRGGARRRLAARARRLARSAAVNGSAPTCVGVGRWRWSRCVLLRRRRGDATPTAAARRRSATSASAATATCPAGVAPAPR